MAQDQGCTSGGRARTLPNMTKEQKVTFNPDQQKDKETKAKGKTNKAQNREQTQNGILKTLYLLFKGLKGLVPFQRKLYAGENEDDLERNSPFPYSWFV